MNPAWADLGKVRSYHADREGKGRSRGHSSCGVSGKQKLTPSHLGLHLRAHVNPLESGPAVSFAESSEK